MQISQEDTGPNGDIARTCESPTSAIDNVIRTELRGVDAGLAPPPKPEAASVIDSQQSPPPPGFQLQPPIALPPTVDLPPIARHGAPEDLASPPAPPSTRPDALPVAGASGARRGRVAAIAAVFVAGGLGVVITRPLLPSDPAALSSSTPAVRAPDARPDVRPPDVRPPDVRRTSAPPGAAAPLDASGPPKWVRTRTAWASDGSRINGVELAAENDVRVWMNRVRPVLGVRCLARRIEAFVITDAATSIESVPDVHTIHVSFDGQEQSDERWVDSESKKELFAPDGARLADQLARAHTMRFGFTPYGAAPVVADFDVRGFELPTCESPRMKVAARLAHPARR